MTVYYVFIDATLIEILTIKISSVVKFLLND